MRNRRTMKHPERKNITRNSGRDVDSGKTSARREKRNTQRVLKKSLLIRKMSIQLLNSINRM